MTRKGIKVLGDGGQVLRPLCVSVAAIAILSAVMAWMGRQWATAALGGVILLIAGLAVFQVRWAVRLRDRDSQAVRQAADRAEKHYIDVLWRIVQFVESRDKHQEGHSQRVAELAARIARQMKLPKGQCEDLELAGRLHDLGMMAIPEQVLNQRGVLGVDGFSTVKQHPEIAYEVLRPLGSLADVLPAIRHHHERMNGTGYPDALAGEKIPLGARILAVADVYDAMTHDRFRRPAMSPLAAMEELRRCSPAGYDPDCVEALGELKQLPRLRAAFCDSDPVEVA